jgi:hypothetical protein
MFESRFHNGGASSLDCAARREVCPSISGLARKDTQTHACDEPSKPQVRPPANVPDSTPSGSFTTRDHFPPDCKPVQSLYNRPRFSPTGSCAVFAAVPVANVFPTRRRRNHAKNSRSAASRPSVASNMDSDPSCITQSQTKPRRCAVARLLFLRFYVSGIVSLVKALIFYSPFPPMLVASGLAANSFLKNVV